MRQFLMCHSFMHSYPYWQVRDIANYLEENKVVLPSSGNLTVRRFQQLGIDFGMSGGNSVIAAVLTLLNHPVFRWHRPSAS